MKDYNVKVKLVLKTSFFQSGKNQKEIEDKINKVIMNSISNNKVLSSLFFTNYKPIIKIKFTKYNNEK